MKKYVVLLVIITLLFGGLDNIKEVNDLAVVKAMGIDKTEDGEYEITAIVMDSGKEEKNSGKLYSSKGKNIQEAIRNMVGITPKRIYLAHMQALIVCENVAKEDFENTLDFFVRDNEGSNSFYLFIAKDSNAKEVIEKVNDEKLDMVTFLESSQKYKGNANVENLNVIIKDILRPGIEACVNTITIDEDKIRIDSMAYFDSFELKGFLSLEESILYNLITNNTNNIMFELNNNDDLKAIEINHSKACLKQNNKDKNKIDLNITMDGIIYGTGKSIVVRDNNDLNTFEKEFENNLKAKIDTFIYKIKNEYKSDMLGIENIYYRNNKLNEYNVDNYEVDVTVDFEITNQGGVLKKDENTGK